ncbi:MAG TPA: copper chaperone PCu(A)C [Nocardioidaceae bacterium]
MSASLLRPARTRARARGLRVAGLGAALLVGLTACGTSSADEPAATDEPTVVVSDAWVRATAGTDDPSMTGAFMAIDNEGDEDVTLTGASSAVAGKVELHEMAMKDGAMVMRKIEDGILVEASYGQVLMPGGNHVMLMGLTEELAPGDEVDLVLEFSDGSTEELTVPVKEFTEEEGHYHEPGTASDHPHMGGSPSMDGSMGPSMSPSEAPEGDSQ